MCMKKILTFATCTLTALFMVSCAKNDPRIGELLNDDPSANPNVSIAYLKNTDAPFSSINKDVLYLISEDKYKDLESGMVDFSFPIRITKALSHDITVEVIEGAESSDDANQFALLKLGDQIQSKVSKVTIKAGSLTSEGNAVFMVDLKKLNGPNYIFPVTLKIGDDIKDCIVSHNFGSMDLRLNINYSLEGLIEMGTKVDPSLTEFTNVKDLKFGVYELFDPILFDNNLETAQTKYAYYDAIDLKKLNAEVSGFSIQPRWDAGRSAFIEIAKQVEILLRDADDNIQNVGRFTLPDFSSMKKEDNPIIVFKFKKSIKIQGLLIRDANREDDYYREFSIS